MNNAMDHGSDAGPAKAWWFLDSLVVEHPTAPDVQLVVLEMRMPVGSSPGLHIHDDLDDAWFILDGKFAMRCGADERIAEAGDWISMPRGIPHTFRVIGEREGRILQVHNNATFRDFVRDVGGPTQSRTVPPQPVFPAMEQLARVAAAHRIRTVGPPMSAADSEAILARV